MESFAIKVITLQKVQSMLISYFTFFFVGCHALNEREIERASTFASHTNKNHLVDGKWFWDYMDAPHSRPEIARLGLLHNWRFEQLRFDRSTKLLHAYYALYIVYCEITG